MAIKLQGQDLEHMQREGSKALILNIVFFVVLFVGIILVPLVGLGFSAVAVGIAFVLSILYIYLT